MAQDSEEAVKRKEEEVEERKKASHDMVAESIRRELLESTCVPIDGIHTDKSTRTRATTLCYTASNSP